MKNISNVLKAVSVLITILIVIGGCSTTRKTDTQIQQHTSAASDIDRQTNNQFDRESAVNTSETDLSSIVIDFTKVEYSDYTSPLIANDSSEINQANRIRRYGQSEVPNGNRLIKSVLLGRATINNNKRTQTDEQTTSVGVSQTNENKAITTTTQTATSQKTEEKTKHNIIRTLALVSLSLVSLLSVIIFVGYEYWHRKKG